jgi:hypothetical protein
MRFDLWPYISSDHLSVPKFLSFNWSRTWNSSMKIWQQKFLRHSDGTCRFDYETILFTTGRPC